MYNYILRLFIVLYTLSVPSEFSPSLHDLVNANIYKYHPNVPDIQIHTRICKYIQKVSYRFNRRPCISCVEYMFVTIPHLVRTYVTSHIYALCARSFKNFIQKHTANGQYPWSKSVWVLFCLLFLLLTSA